ncbi:hypothetical protein ACFRJ1_36200 [Streptomyces sp. NPDC056773]|uniref:hypothetical protein n=1 Tax=unclassified Streptomyces TaxID=2593676 RepID=UPI0036AD464F
MQILAARNLAARAAMRAPAPRKRPPSTQGRSWSSATGPGPRQSAQGLAYWEDGSMEATRMPIELQRPVWER